MTSDAPFPDHADPRRVAARRLALRTTLAVAALLGAYAVLPAEPGSGWSAALRLVVGVVITVAVVVLQLRLVASHAYPVLRAASALTVIVAVYLVTTSATYLVLSAGEPASFSERLGKLDAFYFTVTVFTTVGFGDIHPVSPAARTIVTVQMLLTLVLLGAVARLVLQVANRAEQRSAEA